MEQSVKDYLARAKVLQLATINDGSPWLCSVYFVADDNFNIYWLSYPTRRHSQNIAANNKVAITVVVNQGLPVIGIQAEGQAKPINSIATISKIMPKYITKYGSGSNFLKLVKEQKNKHRIYKFTPSYLQLFDEQNYNPKDNPIIINLNK